MHLLDTLETQTSEDRDGISDIINEILSLHHLLNISNPDTTFEIILHEPGLKLIARYGIKLPLGRLCSSTLDHVEELKAKGFKIEFY